MKYIPGYKFIVPNDSARISPRVKTVSDIVSGSLNKSIPIKGLESGTEYSIFNIKPKIDKGNVVNVTYVFRSRKGLTEIIFSSVGDAEKKLDSLIGNPQVEDATSKRDEIKRNLTAFAKSRLRR